MEKKDFFNFHNFFYCTSGVQPLKLSLVFSIVVWGNEFLKKLFFHFQVSFFQFLMCEPFDAIFGIVLCKTIFHEK